MSTRPFLRWVGGKRQILHSILPKFPEFDRYYEPFVGGGAVFFALSPEDAVISDFNPSLVSMYKIVADYPEEICSSVEQMLFEFSPDQYYTVRSLFNKLKVGFRPNNLGNMDASLLIEFASMFVYLNRTSYNGLWRENKRGAYNAPVGKFSSGPSIDRKSVLAAAKLLRNATIRCGDFCDAVRDAQEGDLVYLDPPYAQVDQTSFKDFTKDSFTPDDHRRLAKLASDLNQRGVSVFVSNSDTPFVHSLFENFNFYTTEERQIINSDATKRGFRGTVMISNR